jgi:membrane dipeptidase
VNFPVFDLHCDTADILIRDDDDITCELYSNSAHIDLKRAGELHGYVQCFACYSTYGKKNPVDLFEKKMIAILSEIAKNENRIRQVFTAEDIENNIQNGLMSAILTIEGPAGFGFDPALLEDLYKVGFRISTLGHNENNPLTGSHITGGGLTEQGRAYVNEAQRLGMIIDVSHISDEGFWQIMDMIQAPVIASHSNSRAVCDVSRNLTDEMFTEICKVGGVAGVNLYSCFVGAEPTLDSVCDHIFHFMELDPTGKHIALGGDLDGCDTLPKGISGIESYPALANRLLERGLDDTTVHNIFWNNAMEVFKRCCT